MQRVFNGIDSFIQEPGINKNTRIAIVTNNAAFTSDRMLSRVALKKEGFNLTKIFSPEHGISGKGTDGFYQNHIIDFKTDLPIVSLYSDRLMPTQEDLENVDVVLFDIPDVGCRFYTYLWTMTYVMEACAKYKRKFIVLDRPNPTGGNLEMVEGPLLDEVNCSSFIGRWSIPVRHCCTIGELALYFAEKKVRGLDLEIIPVKSWKRYQIAEDFYPTSPAIQNILTALVYPGMGLLEGINVNEGRGTEKPFLKFGAPWINAPELQEYLSRKHVNGFKLSPCSYVPADSLYKGENCNGLELTVTDKKTIKPVSFGIELISRLLKLYPQAVSERAYVTNANPTGVKHLDKLLGIFNVLELLKTNGQLSTDIYETWQKEIASCLLYD